MKNYSASIEHNTNTYKKLCSVRYKLFGKAAEMKFTVLGAAIVLLSLVVSNSTVSIVILFIGCWVIISGQTPPMRMAKKMIDSVKGDFPHTVYIFHETDFAAKNKFRSLSANYSDIKQIVYDKEFIYLFQENQAAYMIRNDSIIPEHAENSNSISEVYIEENIFESFLADLEAKTHLKAVSISELSTFKYITSRMNSPIISGNHNEPPHL